MAMKIMDSYNDHTIGYTDMTKRADSAEDRVHAKEGDVITSTVGLKTSTAGVTRTEQIKTGFRTVNDYSKYLQSKYSYMNAGTTSMQGVPTTVSVSSAFLQKCKDDPEKARYLEENLAAIPDCAKMAVNGCLGTLTSLSYQVDANGNITCISSGTNDPDGRIARENAERKAKEKKAAEEKAAKRREEKRVKKEGDKKRVERRADDGSKADMRAYRISAAGTDIKAVTGRIIDLSLDASVSARAGLDIKA